MDGKYRQNFNQFYFPADTIQGVSNKILSLKMLTKENLLAIDCKHVLRAVSVLTFGSLTFTFEKIV